MGNETHPVLARHLLEASLRPSKPAFEGTRRCVMLHRFVSKLRGSLGGAGLLLLLAAPAFGQSARILVEGAPLVGGANGLAFDADGNLVVASVFGRR